MKHFLVFLLLSAATLAMKGQTVFRRNVDIDLLRSTSLPVLDIVTTDGSEPTYDEVTHPPGAMGMSIANATKVPARMTMTLGPDTLYDSGPYLPDQSGLTIKVRGNTSAYNLQKPYKIKLEKKADLLGRGNDARFKDKHWVLLADAALETAIGFAVSRLVGMEWTPASEYVNVVLNGQYRGMYTLCEQVRRNPDCRINVDKQTGYIVEYDAYWWNEDRWFETTSGRKYTFKYPESDEVTLAQSDYIRQALSDFEESIARGTMAQHIDVGSFARWLFAHDVLGTWDSGGSNLFVAKQDETQASLLRMPCLWDFNTICKMTDKWSRMHTDSYTWFPALMDSPDGMFCSTYASLFQELLPTVFDGLDQWLADLSASPLLSSVERSIQWTAQTYGYTSGLFAESIDHRRRWFRQRRDWMAKAAEEIVPPTAVASPTEDNKNGDPVFDLAGRRVGADAQGFVVHRGKVYFNQ